MNERVFIMSLGCDKNRIDAEVMAASLEAGGYSLAGSPAEADCAIVNSCAFIEDARKEAIEAVFDMVREKENPESPLRAVVLTGCMAERYRNEASELMPELDGVVGIALNPDICATVEQALAGGRRVAFDRPERLPLCGKRAVSTPTHYAYIKIAEGCDNRCTYCAIPGIRGRFRSRAADDILAEAAELLNAGVKELIVIAQDTTSYGRDLGGGECLSSLLGRLCKLDFWKVRLLYAYPDRMDDRLIDFLSGEPRMARYLDLPLQHCDAGVLRRMGRSGSRASLEQLIGHLRAKVPGISLRSTFIVGFPGESEQQFGELLDFIKTVRFDRAGCFAFSPEEGTAALRLDGALPDEERAERADRFMRLQTDILAESRPRMIGECLEVICDGFDGESGLWRCRSEFDAPEIDTFVYVEGGQHQPGDVFTAEITGCDRYDLYGRDTAVEIEGRDEYNVSQ